MDEQKLFAKTVKYFERLNPDDDTNPKFKCLIESCNKNYCAKHQTNIIKHVRRMHANFFASNIQVQKEKLSLPQKRLKFIQNSVEVVTINGRSFKHLDDSGHKKLVEEKMNELIATGYGEGLGGPHFTAIKENIAYLAKEVKTKIKEEVKDRYVSLMIDFATKHRRSIMGVSLQYVHNGKIEIRTIGMLQMHSSSTSANALNVLSELLNSYGIEKTRVVSVTTDNASNLSLMVKLLNETIERESQDNEGGTENTAQSSELEFENSEHNNPSVLFDFEDIDAEICLAIESLEPNESDSDEELNEMLNNDDVILQSC